MALPAKYTLNAYRGDKFEQIIKIKTDGVAVNLTGQTIMAQVRADTDLTSAKLLDFSIARVDLNGQITISLTGAQTQNLEEGVYAYDVQVGDTTQLYGPFVLTGDVSR